MRVRCMLGVLVVLAGSIARGQELSIAGRVVDAIPGSPVGHTAVAVESLEAGGGPDGLGRSRAHALQGATTGADGRFVFTGLAPGRYRLSAARRGYLEENLDQHGGFFAAVIVGANHPEATRLVFPLLPTATIAGTVLDSSGDMVSGSSVTLFMRSFDGTAAIRQVRTAFLQPGGSSYAFDGLAPGTYYVAAHGSPWFAVGGAPGISAGPFTVAYALTFYPNGTSTAEAQPIVVKAGETAEADFSLNAVPAVHLAVPVQPGAMSPALRVAAFDGSVGVGVGVGSRRQERGQPAVTTIEFLVAPGDYLVGAGRDGVPFHVTEDVTLGDVSTPATVPVTGRVAMVDGGPLPAGLTVRFAPVPDGAGQDRSRFGGIGFRREGAGGLSLQPVEVAVVADGSFRAAAVPPGEYRVSASATADSALVPAGAAATGGQISDTLTLHVGAEPVVLAATFAAARSAVTGRVVGSDGAPAIGMMVLLVPRDASQGGLSRQGESDSDGTWTLRGVAAGAYTAVAIRDGWDLAWRTPAVLAGYLKAGGEAVVVPAGGAVGLEKDLVVLGR